MKQSEKIVSIKKEYEEDLLKISKVVGVLAKKEALCIFVEDVATCKNVQQKILRKR